MKYSINIRSVPSLEVCVGRFETFKEAKTQMAEFIIELIANQKGKYFDDWENLKEDFSGEIQGILNGFESFGTAFIDDEVEREINNESDNVSYYSDERVFEISGKYSEDGYNLSINTNAINMDDPDENYYFTLTVGCEGGDDELTIELLVNDGSVEVYNIIPDDVRSRLEPVDLDDE